MTDDLAKRIEELVDAKIANAARGGASTVPAEFVGTDENGKSWVMLPGATEATPVKTLSVEASPGDTVSVTVRDLRAHVESNLSNPSAGLDGVRAVESTAVAATSKASAAQASADSASQKAGQAKAAADKARTDALEAAGNAMGMAEEALETASDAGETAASAASASRSAQAAAAEAKRVSDATNQHFWHRITDPGGDGAGTGAFVTDEEQDAFLEAIASGTQPTAQRPLHNLLMNAEGIVLRAAKKVRAAFTPSGVAFYDGDGNAASNIVAQFSKTIARIGKAAGKHVDVTSTGMDILDGSASLASIEAGSMRIGKVGSGSFNTYVDANGVHLRCNTADMASFAATSLDFYDTSGASALQLTTNNANGNVRVGRADKWHTLIGSSYGFRSVDPDGTIRANINNSGFYLRNAKDGDTAAVTTAELLANGSMRLGKLSECHYFGNATSLGFYPADAVHATTAGNANNGESLLSISTTPAVRIGAYAKKHLYLTDTALYFFPESTNTANNAYSMFGAGTVRLGQYTGNHAYVDGSSFGFYPASTNAAANAYTRIEEGYVRLGQQAADTKNMVLDSDGITLRNNTTMLAKVSADSNGIAYLTGVKQAAIASGKMASRVIVSDDVEGSDGTYIMGASRDSESSNRYTSVGLGFKNNSIYLIRGEGQDSGTLGPSSSMEWVPLYVDGDVAAGWVLSENLDISKHSGETKVTAYRSDKGTGVFMGVGAGGINHGVYSNTQAKWLVHADASSIYVAGMKINAVTKNATIADNATAATNITLSSVQFAHWGKVAQLRVEFQSSTARTGNFNVCTLVSGKRPAYVASATVWRNGARGNIGTGGVVEVNGGTDGIPANTNVILLATYILA